MGQPPRPVIACTASMYMESTSGRSSRSTLMLTKSEFINVAVSTSSKHSCAMTWHQWQAEYPTDSRMGTFRRLASSNASSPHAYQSTGLSRCWRRYGLVSFSRRLVIGFSFARKKCLVDWKQHREAERGERCCGLHCYLQFAASRGSRCNNNLWFDCAVLV